MSEPKLKRWASNRFVLSVYFLFLSLFTLISPFFARKLILNNSRQTQQDINERIDKKLNK